MPRQLILLVGLPRSGTSWIGKIFDSHPATLYRHEPDAGGRLNAIPLVAPAERAGDYRDVVERFVEGLPSLNSTKVAASTPVFPKRYLPPVRFAAYRLAVMAAKASGKVLGREVPVPRVARYRHVPDLPVVWKSVESTGRVGVIVSAVPGCRAILILRHPCGQVASVLRGEAAGKFTAREPSSDDYELFEMLLQSPRARGRGLTLEALKGLSPIERLAWRWRLFNEKGLDDIAGRPECRMVRYEDICTDPIGRARELLAFAGLDRDPQTEAFVRESTRRDSTAYYSIFKDPVRSATEWQHHLSAEDIDRVFRVIKDSPLADVYPPDHLGASGTRVAR